MRNVTKLPLEIYHNMDDIDFIGTFRKLAVDDAGVVVVVVVAVAVAAVFKAGRRGGPSPSGTMPGGTFPAASEPPTFFTDMGTIATRGLSL
jgi:hypothetical protein